MLSVMVAGRGSVVELAELMMILELHRQGLSVSAISRTCGIDRKTIRKYIDRGLEAPAYSARAPRSTVIDPFADYLRERVKSYPGLTGQRLLRELKSLGYQGGYTMVKVFLRDVRRARRHDAEARRRQRARHGRGDRLAAALRARGFGGRAEAQGLRDHLGEARRRASLPHRHPKADA
jgi:transposase